MARPKSANESEILSRRVLVLVSRDQTTKTPRVVWAHELPILEAMFGEGAAVEIDPTTMDDGYTDKVAPSTLIYNKQQDPQRKPSEAAGIGYVFIGSQRAEYDRMVACYSTNEKGVPWVESIYGRFAAGRFAQLVGSPTLADLPDQQLRQVIKAYGYSLPVVTFESNDIERAQAKKAYAEFEALTGPALVKLAEQIGVEIGR